MSALAIYHLPRKLMLYVEDGETALNVDELVEYVKGKLPYLPIELRNEFVLHHVGNERTALQDIAKQVASARIFRIDANEVVNEPFPAEVDYEYRRLSQCSKNLLGTFYSAYHLQTIYWKLVRPSERSLSYVHIILTKLLIGTFDDASGRWHARTIVLGYPNIISLRGLVEAPAKPREFYALKRAITALGGELPTDAIINALRDCSLTGLEDSRMTEVVKGYILQAIAYHVSLKPFCEDASCRLYNAHWQRELLRAQLDGDYELCTYHEQLFTYLAQHTIQDGA
ncbi:MAG TPA: hypothetical protein EYP10_09570 [Armatimonadetes bacterium]|nr:hypothetical protein [Armatimonadota bacterium]